VIRVNSCGVYLVQQILAQISDVIFATVLGGARFILVNEEHIDTACTVGEVSGTCEVEHLGGSVRLRTSSVAASRVRSSRPTIVRQLRIIIRQEI